MYLITDKFTDRVIDWYVVLYLPQIVPKSIEVIFEDDLFGTRFTATDPCSCFWTMRTMGGRVFKNYRENIIVFNTLLSSPSLVKSHKLSSFITDISLHRKLNRGLFKF